MILGIQAMRRVGIPPVICLQSHPGVILHSLIKGCYRKLIQNLSKIKPVKNNSNLQEKLEVLPYGQGTKEVFKYLK